MSGASFTPAEPNCDSPYLNVNVRVAPHDHLDYLNQDRGDARYSKLGHTHDLTADGYLTMGDAEEHFVKQNSVRFIFQSGLRFVGRDKAFTNSQREYIASIDGNPPDDWRIGLAIPGDLSAQSQADYTSDAGLGGHTHVIKHTSHPTGVSILSSDVDASLTLKNLHLEGIEVEGPAYGTLPGAKKAFVIDGNGMRFGLPVYADFLGDFPADEYLTQVAGDARYWRQGQGAPPGTSDGEHEPSGTGAHSHTTYASHSEVQQKVDEHAGSNTAHASIFNDYALVDHPHDGYVTTELLTQTLAGKDADRVQWPGYAFLNHTHDDVSLPTAQELLDAIKQVDGANSGLDADLFDGQESSYYSVNGHTHAIYVKTDGSTPITADQTVQGNVKLGLSTNPYGVGPGYGGLSMRANLVSWGWANGLLYYRNGTSFDAANQLGFAGMEGGVDTVDRFVVGRTNTDWWFKVTPDGVATAATELVAPTLTTTSATIKSTTMLQLLSYMDKTVLRDLATGDSYLSIGVGRKAAGGADGTSYIDFYAVAGGATYQARIRRYTGTNGNFEIFNAGTGILYLNALGRVQAQVTGKTYIDIAASAVTIGASDKLDTLTMQGEKLNYFGPYSTAGAALYADSQVNFGVDASNPRLRVNWKADDTGMILYGAVAGDYGATFRITRGAGTKVATLALDDRSGTPHYLWVDSNGKLRIGTSRPTSTTADTSGVIVGAQT